MKKQVMTFVIALLLSQPPSVLADNLFLEAGGGIFKSFHSQAVLLRYQHDTSRLFGRPSYWEGVAAYWNNSAHANAFGVARGIAWNKNDRRAFTTTFGLVGLTRETEHSGTLFQFYFRFAYDFTVWQQDLSLGFIHISNGKLIFRWKGPNSGENFLTLSVGLF